MNKLKHKQLVRLETGKYHDGGGLYISLSSQGKGKWSYRYYMHKRAREKGLGTFPEVTLAEARIKAHALKVQVAKNIDPIEESRKEAVLRQLKNERFSHIADLYITEKKLKEWTNPKSEQQWRNTIATYASPILDRKPFQDINHDDVIEVLNTIWTTKTETARRLQQRLFKIFSFAKVRKWYSHENPAHWKDHLVHVLSDPYKIQVVKHHSSLEYQDLPSLYADLKKYDTLGAIALRLLILTAGRTKEIIDARFNEFNLPKRLWTIPPEKMKAKKEHKVPLSEEAISLLKLMRKKHNHNIVFYNSFTEKQISNGAMLKFLKQNFPQFKITVHGFRASFRNWAEETGKYQYHAIEFSLSHQLPNKVEKAYLRSNLIEIRRDLMDDWERFILMKHH